MNEQKKIFLIKGPYWLGIVADGLWAVGLFSPRLFSILTGRPDFHPDLEVRLIMGIGGSLMTGWTFLLLWAVRKPIERRVISLLTAFPVIFGLFIVTLIGVLEGNTFGIWILTKLSVIFVSMVTSYIIAGKMGKKEAHVP
jgi:hypothetical protein